MKTLKIVIFMLILFISVGAVCATDAYSEDNLSDDNQDILETTQDDVLAVGEPKTFTDLRDDISNSTGVFDVKDNYKFNNGSDNNTPIIIGQDNFVILGNGHTIDASGQSSIFQISAKNVTINNLTFINANSSRGSVFSIMVNCSLTTNDVVLMNNTAENCVIAVYGTYFSNNDKFTDFTSKFTVIRLFDDSVLNVDNAVMMNSKILQWGFIYTEAQNCNITILNSLFANSTSNYTAVRGSTRTMIQNCQFVNLHAITSAGAIGVKDLVSAEINNCTFVNVTSEKNAGAILVDVNAYDSMNIARIHNCDFIDCYSGFGGALMQYDGRLYLTNCTFKNNDVLFDGGAIYLSCLKSAFISDSIFIGNDAQFDGPRGSFGGAIFCDNSLLRLDNNEFINSSAQCGGALYLYDSNYYFSNNTFVNNTNQEGNFDDIFTVFDWSLAILENNTYSSDDSCSFNNTNYRTIIAAEGMKLTILNNTIDVANLPSRFDLRDWGWATPVRDQGRMGSCWAFGATGAIESAILRYLGIEMDVSENNMQDSALQYSPYGQIGLMEGGFGINGVLYALSWFGVFSSEYDTYDQLGKISPIIASEDSVHFQDVIFIPPLNSSSDIDQLKRVILKYGAVDITYCAEQMPPYLNLNTSAQYCNESLASDHCVVLIGWDDNYSADNFLITPPDDGAWIVKNSWGEDAGDEGYYYISYYDKTFAATEISFAYLLENTVEYNKNYQYDIGGTLGYYFNYNEYLNNFTAVEDDLLAAVGTYFNDSNVEYTVKIYVNGVLKHIQSGLSPFGGFHTIKLDSYVPIKEGDKFDVVIKSNWAPIIRNSRQHYQSNVSLINTPEGWAEVTPRNYVCAIKAYTVKDDSKIINDNDISVDYAGGSYFSVKVVTDDGHAIGAGEKVTFLINKKTTTVTTDKDGIAKIKITDVPGKYTITTKYNGKTYTNKVTVKQVLTTSKVTVKKTAKSFTLQAKLKINGKLVKGKTITFKFKGKSYHAKTNAKGIAKVTIKQDVIKKLKKGKTYTFAATYLKDTIKSTVKVI
ncbi:C1 family peptidase [Methanobrevibacter sp.]|uniref:C1 family peptidase n=1 Tax=Methanobrevibacter sp. TaxID=66852 RepID=UPI00388F7594